LYINPNHKATPYVRSAKELIHKNGFTEVELHAAGESSIHTLTVVVGILTEHGYVSVSRIKTSTLVTNEGQHLAKLMIRVAKSEAFEEIYEAFEEDVKKKWGPKETQQDNQGSDSAPPKSAIEEEEKHAAYPNGDEGQSEVPFADQKEDQDEEQKASSLTEEAVKSLTDSSCGTEDRKLYNGEKWWLQGIPKEELIKLVDDEDDGEPEIYM